MKKSSLQIHVTRGTQLESLHEVDAVLIDGDGKIVESYGESNSLCFPRSAIKLAQAIVLTESGASEKFNLSNQWIALACASHFAEKIHTENVQAWLEKIGESVTSLECGTHLPYDETTKYQMIRAGEIANAVHNNCSGKHCGMITTAKFFGESVKDYSKYDHPVQSRLRKTLGELAGIDYEKAPWGIDGCAIPSYAIPLEKLALTMSLFLDGKIKAKANSARKFATDQILKAVVEQPHMIAGSKALSSKIIEVSEGRAIAKSGAEGVYVALLPGQSLSIAVKCKDGAARAAELAILHLLHQHGGLTTDELDQLLPLTSTKIRNWAGLVVGEAFVEI